jgi:hypothetical protein
MVATVGAAVRDADCCLAERLRRHCGRRREGRHCIVVDDASDASDDGRGANDGEGEIRALSWRMHWFLTLERKKKKKKKKSCQKHRVEQREANTNPTYQTGSEHTINQRPIISTIEKSTLNTVVPTIGPMQRGMRDSVGRSGGG